MRGARKYAVAAGALLGGLGLFLLGVAIFMAVLRAAL